MKKPYNHKEHMQTQRMNLGYKEKENQARRDKRQRQKTNMTDEQIAAKREQMRKQKAAERLKKKTEAQKASETKLVAE